MKLPRRQFLHLAAGAAALPAASRLAWAQAYPAQPVVIDNRPGAGTNLATESVVNAPPDGYTLLMASTAAFTNATLYDNLRFNFIRDIAPVASLSRGAFVMVVNPSFAARTVPEFIAHAKANPGKINVASGGIGTANHVAGEMFKTMAGIDMVHVPYRSDGAALTDLLGDRIQVYFVALAGAAGFIRDGKVRALGVTTADRTSAFPQIPAIGEFVPGFEANLRNGLGAPRGTPAEIIETLNAAVNAGLNDPTIKARFADLGSETAPLTPAEWGKIIVEETEKWGKVIRAAGIKAQ